MVAAHVHKYKESSEHSETVFLAVPHHQDLALAAALNRASPHPSLCL